MSINTFTIIFLKLLLTISLFVNIDVTYFYIVICNKNVKIKGECGAI